MKRQCARCGNWIQTGRLEALPETTTCIQCSQVKAKTITDVETDGPDPVDLQRRIDEVST